MKIFILLIKATRQPRNGSSSRLTQVGSGLAMAITIIMAMRSLFRSFLTTSNEVHSSGLLMSKTRSVSMLNDGESTKEVIHHKYDDTNYDPVITKPFEAVFGKEGDE